MPLENSNWKANSITRYQNPWCALQGVLANMVHPQHQRWYRVPKGYQDMASLATTTEPPRLLSLLFCSGLNHEVPKIEGEYLLNQLSSGLRRETAKWTGHTGGPSPSLLFLILKGLDLSGTPLLTLFCLPFQLSVLSIWCAGPVPPHPTAPRVVWAPRLARTGLCIVHTYKYLFYVDRGIFCK